MQKYRKLYRAFIPPEKWRIMVIIMMGVIAGLLLLAFRASNAIAYLSDNPETCINCHVMYSQYSSWEHSSHASVTNCNDCHVPHNNFFNKYFFKAKDGMRHATIFTLRKEDQVIRIKNAGKQVVLENCKRCHYNQINMVDLAIVSYKDVMKGNGKFCWDCHTDVPHTSVNSLSSAPFGVVPHLKSIVPDWIKTNVK